MKNLESNSGHSLHSQFFVLRSAFSVNEKRTGRVPVLQRTSNQPRCALCRPVDELIREGQRFPSVALRLGRITSEGGLPHLAHMGAQVGGQGAGIPVPAGMTIDLIGESIG